MPGTSQHNESDVMTFNTYISNYKKIVLKVANAYTYDKEQRKDLVQDIILQLWKAFPSFNDKYSISTWTYRIALNVSISFLRKEKTRKRSKKQYADLAPLVSFNEVVIDERLEKLNKCINLLKPINKAVIILHLEGCRNKEIAEIMGLTPSNISTRMMRIRQTLKNCIQPIKQ